MFFTGQSYVCVCVTTWHQHVTDNKNTYSTFMVQRFSIISRIHMPKCKSKICITSSYIYSMCKVCMYGCLWTFCFILCHVSSVPAATSSPISCSDRPSWRALLCSRGGAGSGCDEGVMALQWYFLLPDTGFVKILNQERVSTNYFFCRHHSAL